MRIVVFGNKGMLGRYVYTYFKSKGYDMVGISRSTFDATKLESFSLIRQVLHREDIVINCIGIIKRKDVPKSDFALVNSAFPYVLASVCEEVGCKLIHITTDCVFDGSEGNYNEEHEHTARDLYGMSKSVGEPENATIIRTSIIGEEVDQSRSLVEWIKSSKNKKVSGYTNHWWNGITCLQFAKICEEIVEKNLFWKGVKHITSPSYINKYNLVRLVSEIYELNVGVVPHETEVKCDRTLSSVRNDIVFYVPELRDQLVEMREFYKKLVKEQ